ncbi:indolepyruvate oxidoreductase subunit beta [Paenibacillus lutimineralis]|uniref:Indolepyruvate oxidoreductase subunit beta n=1 Tax=Paenibacillus lutimineralis TaxID=2707005 RepID=A0A3Q9I717_9BACL|nr:indolepyruvate oxidoreductase subunit beta [Paenibacillus lutimineralis]AZS14153.1 indolepyruvate oxidoreductase subunit beta [Paenibacillus lutimineralis]
MSESISIILAGIGGKGVITVTNVLSHGLVTLGYDVKVSEVHGMSQRGGSVHAQVRFGTSIHSPLIEKGTADYIVGFDQVEALRWGSFLKLEGRMLVNMAELKDDTYKGIYESSFSQYLNTTFIQASTIARETGNIRNENFVMLGALLQSLGFEFDVWRPTMEKYIKKQFQEGSILSLLGGMREQLAAEEKETVYGL